MLRSNILLFYFLPTEQEQISASVTMALPNGTQRSVSSSAGPSTRTQNKDTIREAKCPTLNK